MKGDLISRKAVQDMIDRIAEMHPYRQIGKPETYSEYNEAWEDAVNRIDAELNDLPSVQPEHLVKESGNLVKSLVNDCISRQAAIDAVHKEFDECLVWDESGKHTADEVERVLTDVPSAQPEIIHCCDCIYYDPEHIEKNGVRYEYRDMPKDAFDSLGTGMVNSEYGINVGGRCCRDYNVGYSEDKRVFVSGQNYCGRAERRQDADSSGNMSGTHKNSNSTETHSCDCERTETHDLISRQLAIKTFHDEIVRRRIDEDTNDDGTLDEFDTEAILRRLPSVQPESRREWYMKGYRDAQPRWIPVTERLPDKNGDYFVTYDAGFAEDYGYDVPIGIAPYEVDCESFGVWQECFDPRTLGVIDSDWVEIKVVAWLPLPEAYEGGQG